MVCSLCQGIRQYGLNALLLLDKGANALVFLGDPNETLSRRCARAARAGRWFGIAACKVLGWISSNHCEWSLEPGSIGAEIVHWSPLDADAQKIVVTPQPTAGS